MVPHVLSPVRVGSRFSGSVRIEPTIIEKTGNADDGDGFGLNLFFASGGVALSQGTKTHMFSPDPESAEFFHSPLGDSASFCFFHGPIDAELGLFFTDPTAQALAGFDFDGPLDALAGRLAAFPRARFVMNNDSEEGVISTEFLIEGDVRIDNIPPPEPAPEPATLFSVGGAAIAATIQRRRRRASRISVHLS